MYNFITIKNIFKTISNKLGFKFQKYHQGLARQNIQRIFFIFVWAVFMFCFIFMLEKLALVMGGSENIKQGPPNVIINYIAPQQISSYIAFFGHGLGVKGVINKVPHYLSITIIIVTIIVSVALFWPFFYYEAGRKKKYYLIAMIGFYLSVLIIGFVLSILFSTDNKSLPLLKILSWCILTTEIFSLIIMIKNYQTIKQMNVIIKSNAKTICPTTDKNKKNYIDDLFYNVDHSQHLSKINVSEDHFFDYEACNNLNINIRKQYIRSKKRELIFFNYKPFLTMLIIIGPTIIQQFIYASYGIVDKLFVVQFAAHAYSNLYNHNLTIDYLNLATRYGSVMQIIIFACSSLITVPGVIMFSYGYARHNQAEINRVVGNSLTLTLILSIILIPIMYFVIPIFINFQIGLNDAGSKVAANMTTGFARIIFYGFPVQILGILFTGWLVAEGRSFISLIILLFSALANCFLNWIILSYTNLGYDGSALANVFVFVFTTVLGFIACATDRYSWIRTRWRDLKPDKNLILNFFSMGTTGVLQALAAGLMIALTVHLTQTLPFDKTDIGGTPTKPTNGLIQAFAASSPWFSLARSFTLGVVFGGRNILAYCYSAQQYQRFRKLALWCFWSQMIWTIFYYILILIFAKNMIGLFISDPNLSTTEYGNYLRILAIGIFSFPFQNMLILVYQATGENRKALFMSSLNAWVLAAPLTFIVWNGVWSGFGQVNTPLIFFILINIRWLTITPIMLIYGWFAGGNVRHILNLPNRESKTKTEIHIFDKIFKKYNYNVNVMANNYKIPTEIAN